MEHLAKISQSEILPGIFIPNIPTIPSMLWVGINGERIYISDGPLMPGDIIEPMFVKRQTIETVIHARPAMSDWSGNSYEGMNPTYNLVTVL